MADTTDTTEGTPEVVEDWRAELLRLADEPEGQTVPHEAVAPWLDAMLARLAAPVDE
jgi:hypothetical protein